MSAGVLYGRDEVVRSLRRALESTGALVTLTGLGGSGRTSVAQAAASLLAGGEPATVEGREATRPGQLAEALEARAGAGLVVVDDADHAPDARRQLRDVHRSHPDLRLLVTASTPLGLPDEVVVRLAPLPVPDPTDDPVTLRAHPAVQLFADVSARTGTAAVLDDASVTAAARIARLLGGLPLAIQLVAARTATYSPATLAILLARSPLQLLHARRGSGDPDDGHDLVGAVSWSISLLTPGERELLRDLAVFRGPVTLPVVDAVCGRPHLVDELSALVDVHLVDPLHDGPDSRFLLPPLVRGHLEASEEGGPSLLVRERHRRWALEVAARAVSLESEGRLDEARGVAVPVEPDLSAALADAVSARDDEAALTLALALVPLAFSRGATPEVCRAVDSVLDLVHATEQDVQGMLPGTGRAHVADRLTLTAWRELLRAEVAESAADVTSTIPALEELRERARQVDDRTLLRVTYVAVQAARSMVERERAEGWAAEGRELAERLGDDARLVRLETWTGMMAHQRGDHAEAADWARRALDRAQVLDDASLALAPAGLLHGLPPEVAAPHTPGLPSPDQLVRYARELGELRALDWLEPTAAFNDLRAGNVVGACGHCAASLRRARATGARLRAAPALLCLFLVALQQGNVTWAGRLQGVVGRFIDVMRPGLPPAAAAAYDQAAQAYRAAAAVHPDAASDVIWGVQLSWDEGVDAALTYAAHECSAARTTSGTAAVLRPAARREPVGQRVADHGPPPRPGSHHGPPRGPADHAVLTSRERDVLELLVAGGTNREISGQLGISAKTVMHHTSSIYRKLSVRGRAEAVAWALRTDAARPEHPHPRPRLRLVEPDA